MTEIETPKVVKKKLFSPIWLLPIIALALGAWLGIKSIRESGVEVQIHFPSATGIDVGKTLVRYQGLTVGKVVDISIDDDLQGVYVDLLMDYRSTPFLRDETKFWLVTPKASITGVEGLDALFSGNYIAIQPGEGDYNSEFIAETQAPPVAPGADGLMIALTSPSLGSLDVGSQIFYRQIPVGKIVSYQLVDDERIVFNAYVQKQYAHLVKTSSHFWNVSGLSVDASLSGISVKSESLSAILAGGVSFSSNSEDDRAITNQQFTLYDNEDTALGGTQFTLLAKDADTIQTGATIVFRGLVIGRVDKSVLVKNGVQFHATIDSEYAHLIGANSQFWPSGADISLSGIKHAARLLTGSVLSFSPGTGEPLAQYTLLEQPPRLDIEPLLLTLTAEENPGVKTGAQVRFKQLPIGQVTQVNFNNDFSGVNYQIEIWSEYQALVTQGSYFTPESALAIEASLDGVSVNTRDLDTLTIGAISLVQGNSHKQSPLNKPLHLFASADKAKQYFDSIEQLNITLASADGAGLAAKSPIYFKKMRIGEVKKVSWQSNSEDFAITLGIEKEFKQLIRKNTVFWRNSAMSIDASLSGVKVDVAPLDGAIKGSVSLGLLDNGQTGNQHHLYGSEALAIATAVPIRLTFSATTKLSANAPIRYLGHQVGQVESVSLNADLSSVDVNAYLYGNYADKFLAMDAQYFLVDAQISLSGITAAETLLTGPYVSVIPGQTTERVNHFSGLMQAPAALPGDDLVVTLKDNSLGSVKVGTPIIFRGLKIGEIKQYRLADDGTGVIMDAHISDKYQHLINTSSQFWDLSGIKVDIGLFSGAQIDTGSLETILAGGIGVATELVSSAENRLSSNNAFVLHDKPESAWLNWAPPQTKSN